MTKIEKLQKRIAAAVARARLLGYDLVARGNWGVSHNRRGGWIPDDTDTESAVCICGAIALAENPADGAGILAAIARKYGITKAQAASLSDGFEGWGEGDGDPLMGYPKHYRHDKVWYRIGRKWRNRADRVDNY